MQTLIKTLFYFGPLVFGIGFLAPLAAQIIALSGWAPPFCMTPLVAGLSMGAALGLIAQVRGRWI